MVHPARRASWWARGVALVVACLTALGGFRPARADTIYWNGTEASWANATAWSTTAGAILPTPGSVPGAADDVIFSISPLFWVNQTVNLGADQAALSLTFNSGGTTLLQGGGTNRLLTLGSGGLAVASGAGVVTIGSGTAGQNVALALNGNQVWTNNSLSPTNAFTLNVINGVSRAAADTTSRTLTLTGTGFTNISGIIANGGASGTFARACTPSGVPATVPARRKASERQCTSRQIPGSMWRLAAISSMKIAGMICAGGKISDSEVMASSEKPKPEYPRTMAARKMSPEARAMGRMSGTAGKGSSFGARKPPLAAGG